MENAINLRINFGDGRVAEKFGLVFKVATISLKTKVGWQELLSKPKKNRFAIEHTNMKFFMTSVPKFNLEIFLKS